MTTAVPNTILFEDNGISLTASPATNNNTDNSRILTLLLDRATNVFNPSLVQSLELALSQVEQAEHPKALIITGKGKFFSNGLDLAFLQSLQSHPSKQQRNQQKQLFIESVWKVLARILVMDCRTVAAMNGHAYGAGLFLALACDFRIMRTNRGYLNWPEVNLGMPLGKGFAELTKAKVTGDVIREGVLCGKRYSSGDALQSGVIDQECPMEELERHAEACAVAGLPANLKAQFFNPASFRQMKQELYSDAYQALVSTSNTTSMTTGPASRL
jgi:enoyl-CoA hydratase/carnithine racemase